MQPGDTPSTKLSPLLRIQLLSGEEKKELEEKL